MKSDKTTGYLKRASLCVFTAVFLFSLLFSPMRVFAWWSTGGVSPDTDTSDVVKSGACGENIVYEMRSSGNLFISGTGAMYDYSSSGAPWRSYAYDNPLYVYFDSGITSIGEYAFGYCYALKSVTFPDTLTQIGDYAFYQAAELQSIVLPEGLTTIGDFAFVACGYPGLDGYDFTSVQLPSTIKTIGESAFSLCTRLTNINLPDGLETLGVGAFASCTALTEIIVPDSVTSIGESAFNSCSQLKKLQLSDNIQVLPKNMFSAVDPKKKSMTEIRLPLQLKVIETAALNGRDLQTIYIPGNVETIAERAFSNFKGAIYFRGDAPEFDTNTFVNSVIIYYPEGNSTWDGIVGQNFGSTITWASYEARCEDDHAYKNGVCTVCGETEPRELVLTNDVVINQSLTEDLYVDLNGFDLSGVIVANGYKVYAMDSTTDGYSCSNIGLFACVDENGELIEPERIYNNGEKQYMAILKDNSYSFHRFFVGVTHMSLEFEMVGLGYKSVIHGDEMVFAQLNKTNALTFMVQLEGNKPVFRSFDRDELTSGNAVTLRIRNYDIENYGETRLFSQVSLMLSDGMCIDTDVVALTFRYMAEQVNINYNEYSHSQLTQFSTILKQFNAVKNWDINNLVP